MTVYSIELNTINLSKMPSTQITIRTCLLISESILRHFLATVLRHNPQAQQMVAKQLITLQWYFCILGRAATDYSENNQLLEIQYIYLERIISIALPIVRSAFRLTTLKDACPKMLLEFMHKLLEDSLNCLKLQLPNMPNEQFSDCKTTVLSITNDLTCYIGTLPSPQRPGTGRTIVPDFKSVIMRLKILDNKDELEVHKDNPVSLT
jgi:hypothetical protein